MWRRWRLFAVVHSGIANKHKLEHGKFLLDIEICPFFFFSFFNHKVSQILDQLAQNGCGISILGSSQKSTGHGPEQPALVEGWLRQPLDSPFLPALFYDWLHCSKILFSYSQKNDIWFSCFLYLYYFVGHLSQFVLVLQFHGLGNHIWRSSEKPEKCGFCFANRHKSSMKETMLSFSFLKLNNFVLNCYQIIYLGFCFQRSLTERISLSLLACFYS